jgi:hypothetical protein
MKFRIGKDEINNLLKLLHESCEVEILSIDVDNGMKIKAKYGSIPSVECSLLMAGKHDLMIAIDDMGFGSKLLPDFLIGAANVAASIVNKDVISILESKFPELIKRDSRNSMIVNIKAVCQKYKIPFYLDFDYVGLGNDTILIEGKIERL